MTITAENAQWIRAERNRGSVGVEPERGDDWHVVGRGSIPLRNAARITTAAARDARGPACIRRGRARGSRTGVGTTAGGEHMTEWDGRDTRGDRTGTGVFFVRLAADGGAVVRRIVRLN